MVDLLDLEKLRLFLYFVIPGVIGVRIWDALVPSPRRDAGDLILNGAAFSVVNVLVVVPIAGVLFPTPMGQNLFAVGLLFALPAVEAYALFRVLASPRLRGRGIVHPTPTAWDYFFRQEKPCWIRLHLKSGPTVFGFFGNRSFATAFPGPPQVYLEEIWAEGEQGTRRMARTAGAIVSMADCEMLEAFTDEEQHDGKP